MRAWRRASFAGLYFRLRESRATVALCTFPLSSSSCRSACSAGSGAASDDTKETAAAEVACAVAPSVASTLTPGDGGVASVWVADAAVAVVSSEVRRRMYKSPTATSDPSTVTSVATALAVAPSVAPTSTSGEGCVASSVPAAGAAVVVASSATRRRMHERKEDMCSALGGEGRS